MAKVNQTDILYDNETLQPLIVEGDFAFGEATNQHVGHLLWAEKGEFRQNAIAGVGLRSFIDGDIDESALESEITLQVELDSMVVQELTIEEETVSVDAWREKSI